MRRTCLAIACALAALLTTAAGAQARRIVPHGFFGTQFANDALRTAPLKVQDAEVGRMARSGIESIRLLFSWNSMQPTSPNSTNFAYTDRVVGLAAKHRISVLALVIGAPKWASTFPAARDYAMWVDTSPRGLARYDAFLRTLIARYGPRGSFWRTHRRLPKIPIRAWQIWNEPGFRYFWRPKNFAKTYVKLLKSAYRTIHRADRKAKVVMAGLANGGQPGTKKLDLSWHDLEAFYRAGVKGHYDVLALHPFAVNFKNASYIVGRNRDVLKKHHDSRKRIWLTEFMYTASKGKLRGGNQSLALTTAQQKRYTKAAYLFFGRKRSWHVDRIYWQPWETVYKPVLDSGDEPRFAYSGMVKPAAGGGFKPAPILSTMVALARKLEGCRKNSFARCVR